MEEAPHSLSPKRKARRAELKLPAWPPSNACSPQRRDRVAIWAPNCAEWAVLQYAAAKVRSGRWGREGPPLVDWAACGLRMWLCPAGSGCPPLQVGAVLVKLNPSLKAGELQYALNKVGCTALVMATELRGTSFVDLAMGVRWVEGGKRGARGAVGCGNRKQDRSVACVADVCDVRCFVRSASVASHPQRLRSAACPQGAHPVAAAHGGARGRGAEG